MTAIVVGFEAAVAAGFDSAWGAAAIRVDDKLVNPTSGRSVSIDRLDELKRDGALTVFEEPICVQDADPTDELVVIAINVESQFREFLVLEQNRLGAILSKSTRANMVISIVRGKDGFEQYARDASARALSWLFEAHDSPFSLALVRAALGLDPRNVWLNALRVHLSPRSDALERLSRLATQDTSGFDECLNALRCAKGEYVLKYEGGAAEGGGFDADVASKLLKALTTVTDFLGKSFVDILSFLPSAPPPRLRAFEAGSAILRIVADVEGRPLGERVARYLELRALERALEGYSPDELRNRKRYMEALNTLVTPAFNTRLLHQPFNSSELQPVGQRLRGATVSHHEDEFSILGVVTGALADAERLEVRIFPGHHGRLMLPLNTDGRGKTPRGLQHIAAGKVDFYTLTRLTVLRRVDEQGSEKTFLLRIEPVRPGSMMRITAIPSSVISGQYRFARLPTTCTERKLRLQLGNRRLETVFSSSKEGSDSWLKAYSETCFEIETARLLHWAKLSHSPPKPPVIAKVLWTLHELGGRATGRELAQAVTQRYGQVVRVNNTRREVIRHPLLMSFSGPDSKTIELSEAGRNWILGYAQVASVEAGPDKEAPFDDQTDLDDELDAEDLSLV